MINVTLISVINEFKMTELAAMNLLQDNGIISDLCLTVGDVATEDTQKAVKYLKLHNNALL